MYPGRLVRFGESDAAVVAALQAALNEALVLHDAAALAVDPAKLVMNRAMVAAVKLFQARNVDAMGMPLKVDGKVGPLTWATLFGVGQTVSRDDAPSGFLHNVLAIAAGEANKQVREVPKNSNSGPEVDRYLMRAGVSPGLPWCCAFTYWCFDEAAQAAGRSNPMLRTAGCLQHWNKAESVGAKRIPAADATADPSLLQPGMAFIVDTGGGTGHTGLVEEVQGGYIATVEGNTDASLTREGVACTGYGENWRTSTRGSLTMLGFDRFMVVSFGLRSCGWRRASHLLFSVGLLAPGCSMAEQVCEVDVGVKPPASGVSAPVVTNPGVRLGVTNPSYVVGCASKQSMCLVSDQLTVTPVPKDTAGKDLETKPIQRICLQLTPKGNAGAPLAEQADWRWVRQDVGRETMQPVTLNLASIIRRWLDDTKAKQLLTENASAKQPVQVSVVTVTTTVSATGASTKTEKLYQYAVDLDLTPLWQDGTLPLELTKAECSPCALGDTVTLTVPQLATWMAATKTPQEKLTLFIGGVRMAGLEAVVNKFDGTVKFQLRRRLASAKDLDAAWTNALPDVLKSGKIKFALGDDKAALTAEQTNSEGFGLGAAVRNWVPGWYLLHVVVSLGILVWVWRARNSGLLRDAYDVAGYPVPLAQRPFSLGRSQMTWWTFLVLLSAWVIVWRTGDPFSINLTALTLIGIGGATFVGSVAQAVPARVTQLMTDYNNAVAGLALTPPTKSAADVEAIKAKLASNNWLTDVLSEYGDDSTAVHRLQNVLFTLMFGCVFFWLACSEGSMPELPAAILGLLGISGGVYAGFKWRTQ